MLDVAEKHNKARIQTEVIRQVMQAPSMKVAEKAIARIPKDPGAGELGKFVALFEIKSQLCWQQKCGDGSIYLSFCYELKVTSFTMQMGWQELLKWWWGFANIIMTVTNDRTLKLISYSLTTCLFTALMVIYFYIELYVKVSPSEQQSMNAS